MPKNVSGGKRAKGMARKRVNGPTKGPIRLRVPECEEERVGVVDKMLGNGMFYVKLDTGEQLLGHIRGKHAGRNKRDNFVKIGGIVLVGLRDFEGDNIKNCDLLEVYGDLELEALSGVVDLSFATSTNKETSENDVQFIIGDDVEFNGADDNQNTGTVEHIHIGNGNIISFEDI